MQPAVGSVALLVGLAGVAGSLILWTTVSYNEAFAYRGGFLLAALATSAVLFSVVTVQRSILAKALSWAPLRYVGRVSYGMYLWHFPLFTYLDGARVHVTGYPLFFVRVAATLVIASASYYLVELPIRRGNLFSSRSLHVLTPVSVAVTAVAAGSRDDRTIGGGRPRTRARRQARGTAGQGVGPRRLDRADLGHWPQ